MSKINDLREKGHFFEMGYQLGYFDGVFTIGLFLKLYIYIYHFNTPVPHHITR